MRNNPRIKNFTRIIEDHNFRFLDAMEDLVRIRDINGEILFENKAMRDELKNSILKRDVNQDTTNLFLELYEDFKQGKESFKREVWIVNKLYAVNASPIYDNFGVTEGYIEVYRDITLERKITSQLYNTNRKTNEDILLAKNIQRSILPTKTNFGNIICQYGHVASNNLSGDIFDVIEISKERIGVYIADVVGHGISASIMTMFIRQSMRSILQENPNFSASETVTELKSMFTQLDLDISQYFTIIYILIDKNSGKMSYVNAGHNCFPILFNETKTGFLHNSGNFISNLFKNSVFIEREVKLSHGDKILLYTDGLTETTDENGEFFGEERLARWVRKNRNEKNFVNKLLNDIQVFRWKKQIDDIAILYLEMK